jgi:hypothetical protein
MSVMSQIKPTQIIPEREVRPNPGAAFPVDLQPNQRFFVLETPTTEKDPGLDTDIGESGGESENLEPIPLVSGDYALPQESVLQDSDPVPATPRIISVKQENINFQDDGTAKIDVILVVEDVDEAAEYDIRVAKNAGNL